MESNLCDELLEIITQQEEVICKQNKMIAELINENAEKENMINVLMSDEFSYT